MDDVATRYAPMIDQIAEMHSGDAAVYAQLRSLRVTRDEWDDNLAGGHFWFEVSGPATDRQEVDAIATDSDGTMIDIIIHAVGGVLKWAEWYRVDGEPLLQWPPASVRLHPR